MKNILVIIFLISVVSIHASIDHHLDHHFDQINGGLSGGNSDIFDGGLIIPKDLKPRNITNLHTGKKEIAITIDDGPTRGVTDKILDVLKLYNVQATFFVLGSKVQKNKSLLERMVREGHIVGNHSMEHKDIGDIKGLFKTKKIKEAIVDSHKLIAPYMTNSSKWYFRAPYGSWQSRAASIINSTEYGSNYYGPLLWDIGGTLEASAFKVKRAADWGCWSKGWSVRKCLRGYINETDEKKGGVALFHDLKSDSVKLIERYIKEYSKRPDYSFISLDDVKID